MILVRELIYSILEILPCNICIILLYQWIWLRLHMIFSHGEVLYHMKILYNYSKETIISFINGTQYFFSFFINGTLCPTTNPRKHQTQT